MHKNAGFTLIELLVVVLIIGILASVALPQYQVAVEKSRAGSLMPSLRTIKNALEVYRLANGEYPPDRIGGLDISLPGCTEDEAGGEYRCENTYYNYEGGPTKTDDYVDAKAAPYGQPYSVNLRMYLDHARGANRGKIFCIPGNKSTTLGPKICKSMGGVQQGSMYLLQ